MAKSQVTVDAAKFAKELKDWFKKDVELYTENKYKKICDDLGRSVIHSTPVLTGQAKNNWYFTTGRPSTSYNPNAKNKAGSGSYGRLRGTVGGLTLKKTFYMANNAPYIDLLERGYSKKAPAGMLKKNLARIEGKYKKL